MVWGAGSNACRRKKVNTFPAPCTQPIFLSHPVGTVSNVMEVRYRYRLRVGDRQAVQLQEIFDSCRYVWNTALGRWSDLWRDEKLSVSFTQACAHLTAQRRQLDWLRAVPVTPQQQVLRDLYGAITCFFDKTSKARRPRFKSKKRGYASARWSKNGFAIRDGRLWVAVATGRTGLRIVWSRPLPSDPKSVTVYRDASGRWWASFVVRVEPEEVGATGETTGLDVGLTTFATTEFADADVARPEFARRQAKVLARFQRNMARKDKDSKNRAKAKRRVARVHARVAAQRHDWQHKQARTLARRFDRIGVEDLRIKNMLANRRLSRAISDAAWGDFLAVLEWHARKCGHEVVRLDPTNTTQTCSECGAKAKQRLGLAKRIFACSDCGLVEGRDRNAARNLNPNRQGRTGVGSDGRKTWEPEGDQAA